MQDAERPEVRRHFVSDADRGTPAGGARRCAALTCVYDADSRPDYQIALKDNLLLERYEMELY